jgi:hypothetical protein
MSSVNIPTYAGGVYLTGGDATKSSVWAGADRSLNLTASMVHLTDVTLSPDGVTPTVLSAALGGLQTGIGENASAIDAEYERALASEGDLSDRISAEATTARAAEEANTLAIEAEATLARGAEQKLSTDISDEFVRATTAEGVNNAAHVINASAIATNAGVLTNHGGRISAIEAFDLQSRMNALEQVVSDLLNPPAEDPPAEDPPAE